MSFACRNDDLIDTVTTYISYEREAFSHSPAESTSRKIRTISGIVVVVHLCAMQQKYSTRVVLRSIEKRVTDENFRNTISINIIQRKDICSKV